MTTVTKDMVLPPIELHAPRVPLALAKRIRVVGLDVDGVLTDGGVYLGATHEQPGATAMPFELKRYDIQDGVGIQLMRDAGLHVVIITGRVSDSVAMRARELGITALVQDPHARKLPALQRLLADLECSLDECAFLGDDLPDLAVLRAVGLPVAVGNAVSEVQRAATLHLSACGGFGAVREFAEALLTSRHEWMDLVEAYVTARSVDAAVHTSVASMV